MRAKYVLIVFQISLILNVTAQEKDKKTYLDEIKISIDNKILVNISITDYNEFIGQQSILDDIEVLQSSIVKTKSGFSEYKTYKIEYTTGKSLVIKEGENKKLYQFKDNNIKLSDLTSECNVNGNTYNMQINFADINDLTNADLKEKIGKTLKKIPVKKPWSGVHNFEVKDTTVIHHEELYKNTGDMDQLYFTGGIGAGVIKNQLLNDFSFRLGLSFSRNGISKYCYYLSFKDYFIFDANNKLKVDGCLNVGFQVNVSKNINKKNWFGLEAGYFIMNRSNLLGKDVFVIGSVKEFGKFSVTPQLYFSDGFNKLFTGISLSFDL